MIEVNLFFHGRQPCHIVAPPSEGWEILIFRMVEEKKRFLNLNTAPVSRINKKASLGV
jgi:hypothetical protein